MQDDRNLGGPHTTVLLTLDGLIARDAIGNDVSGVWAFGDSLVVRCRREARSELWLLSFESQETPFNLLSPRLRRLAEGLEEVTDPVLLGNTIVFADQSGIHYAAMDGDRPAIRASSGVEIDPLCPPAVSRGTVFFVAADQTGQRSIAFWRANESCQVVPNTRFNRMRFALHHDRLFIAHDGGLTITSLTGNVECSPSTLLFQQSCYQFEPVVVANLVVLATVGAHGNGVLMVDWRLKSQVAHPRLGAMDPVGVIRVLDRIVVLAAEQSASLRATQWHARAS